MRSVYCDLSPRRRRRSWPSIISANEAPVERSGLGDYLYWQKADPDTLHRINTQSQDIRRNPFNGLGKPEPLPGDLSGWWSRRDAFQATTASSTSFVVRAMRSGSKSVACCHCYSTRVDSWA